MRDGEKTTSSATRRDESTFSRVLRRKQRQGNIAFIIAFLAFLLPWFLVRIIDVWRGRTFSWNVDWLDVLFLSVPLIIVIASLFFRRIRNRTMELVPAHDGMVCPACVLALSGDSGDGVRTCPRCERQYEPDQLRRYWDLSLTDPLAAASTWSDMMRSQPHAKRISITDILRSWRGKLICMLISVTAIFVMTGIIMAVVMGTSVIAGTLSYVHMFPFMVGMFLFMSAAKRREGATAYCASCKYQMPPGISRTTIANCPECGSPWSEIGGLIHGEVRRRRGPMIAGAILIVLGALPMFFPDTVSTWRSKLLPASALINEVTARNAGFTFGEWAELNTRTLTDQQRITLATGLLDKRHDALYLGKDESTWLDQQIAAGALPDDLVDRYYNESLDIWIIAPERATVGEAMSLAIGSRYRTGLSKGPVPVVLVSGFFVGDETTPRGRQDSSIHGIMLGQVRLQVGGQDSGPGQGPVVQLPAEDAGQLRVRLECWVAHISGGKTSAISWQEDGTPIMPKGAVRMDRRVVEHVIEITD